MLSFIGNSLAFLKHKTTLCKLESQREQLGLRSICIDKCNIFRIQIMLCMCVINLSQTKSTIQKVQKKNHLRQFPASLQEIKTSQYRVDVNLSKD